MKMNHSLVRVWGGVFGLVAAVAGIAASSAEAWARNPILDAVVTEARALRTQGVTPVVVMDLDETVVDSSPRRVAAYDRMVQLLCDGLSVGMAARGGALASGPGPNADFDMCEALRGLNVSELYGLANRYDDAALAHKLGFDAKSKDWRAFADGALEEYLSGQYESLDQPIAGATTFVRELKRAHVQVWFVSSRWEAKQGASTLRSLLSLQLIKRGEEGTVILRPAGMSSIDFKHMAFARIQEATRLEGGRVIGAFENEPENITAMAVEFPGASLVFVEGAWIKPGSVPAQATRIVDYR
jgi:hypothetical protein